MSVLELINLKKNYAHPAGEITVLQGINVRIAAGETVAILGPSGSGKSTLLSLLAGLDRPSSGEVSVLGQNIGILTERKLTRFRAQHLGIVFQQFHLMSHLSALENVALPLEIAGDAQAFAKSREALQQVGLDRRLAHFPHELSGGECQRVAIARALVTRPALLLADEPSGNLDVTTGDQVMSLLFELVRAHRTTLVLVTHNQELAKLCDRQLTLHGGHLSDA